MKKDKTDIPVIGEKYNPDIASSDKKDLNPESVYRKKALKYLFISGLICLAAFITGFIIGPHALRKIWLVTSGTLCIFSGIVIYLLHYQVISVKKDTSDI